MQFVKVTKHTLHDGALKSDFWHNEQRTYHESCSKYWKVVDIDVHHSYNVL